VKPETAQNVSPRKTTVVSSPPGGAAASGSSSSSVSDLERFLSDFEREFDLAEKQDQQSLSKCLTDYEAVEERWRSQQKETADGFNVLEALDLTNNELRHSMLVAWLLNRDVRGRGSHAQGSLGFRLFLEECGGRFGNRRMNTRYADMQYHVRREVAGDESRVDIRIESPGSLLVDIENKISSGEGEDQTGREWRDLHALASRLHVPESAVHAFFLTPDGRPAADPHFKPISYELIARVLDRFAEEARPPDVRLFARHYAEALRKHVISETGEKRKEQYEEPKQHEEPL